MRATNPGTSRRTRKDEEFTTLKRRIALLARFDGDVVRFSQGVFLVRPLKVLNARQLVLDLQKRGHLDAVTVHRLLEIESAPTAIDAAIVATAHRDLRALSEKPALALAREHKKALVRFGRIDEAWLADKRRKVERANEALRSLPGETTWFEEVVSLLRALRGETEAARLAEVGAKIRARPADRRKTAKERVDQVVRALEHGSSDPEIAELADRLDAVRDLRGRARRRRVLEVLRVVVGWPKAPIGLASEVAHAGDFAEHVASAGHRMAAELPVVRSTKQREDALQVVAELALLFPIGDGEITPPDEGEEEAALANHANVLDVIPYADKLTLEKGLALVKLSASHQARKRIARWVAEGLEVDLVEQCAEAKLADNLARVPDVRAARAYATWATRLAGHYKSLAIDFSLSPELFTNLPKNEDLAVLALCLMEHLDEEEHKGDPIAVLDSTLALFERLPAKADKILKNLRADVRGLARESFPEFAAWLDDDALFDRYLHVASLAGQSPPLSGSLREDFEHAERTRRERTHLEGLKTRTAPQQGRLDALTKERTLEGSKNTRTKRRMRERIERLLPTAYRRELDVTFRQILREAWGIEVQAMTPAWRDAVRFWLAVDANRELLGRLLKEIGNESPKLAFEKNREWIKAAKEHIDVDAWLRPRTKSIHVLDKRFTLTTEEDPLEVLRMGIPFGTCLSLDSGCNAASTVMNAIDANKRVLYVRNAGGSIVARKLVAISKDHRLLGYNLYCSVSGDEERAIEAAVLAMCTEIASDARVPLASTGDPEQLHHGFWYDDGTVPFAEDGDVGAYLAMLGLPAAPQWFEELGREASAWAATERGDTTAALAAFSSWNDGPANVRVGNWLVERLGPRGLERLGEQDASAFVAVMVALANQGENGMIRALDVAARMGESQASHHVRPLLARFPPSAKLGAALADVANLALKRHKSISDHGMAHLTLIELPRMFDDVGGALDLLDTVAPTWEAIRQQLAMCKDCVARAVVEAVNVVEAIYARAPVPEIVTAALMSRRRSPLAHQAALRIAARHFLPESTRALDRFAILEPELWQSPDGLAAFLRQNDVEEVTPAIATRAPRTEPPFEALRELVLRVKNLDRLVTDPPNLGEWQPGPWELAWRRRHRNDALRDALFDFALRVTDVPGRHLELLALLGDVERVGRWMNASKPAAAKRTFFVAPSNQHASRAACRATALSIAAQLEATTRFEVPAMPVADAGYVEMARQVLLSTEDDAERRLARAIVLSGTTVDWKRLLETACANGDSETVTRILDDKGSQAFELPVRVVVDVWQLPDARDALVRALVKLPFEDWTARVWAAEREAASRGLAVDDLLEKLALGWAFVNKTDALLEAHTLDQLRSIANVVATEVPPAGVATIINETTDIHSVALFLRALQRQPIDRQAAVREAVLKLDLTNPRGQAVARWTSVKRRSGSSSIDRA